jgi:hypothetical protein
MSAQIDCPICMDCIETSKNCVTTECGHCFHASCLMTSVAHNGFGCPYCRAKMAEEPEEDEETVYTEEEEEEEEEEMFDDYALRGFRFFFDNVNGEPHSDEDLVEEEGDEEDEEEDEVDTNVPSTDFVAQKLREQGVTFEQMVHMLCNLDHQEFREDEQAERFNNELFGKIRIILSNYSPDEVAVIPQQTSQPVSLSLPVPTPTNAIDFDAQPKIYSRRIMMHV